jgi:alkylglycerol monooxygenase
MTQLDTNGYYALGIPAYVLLVASEVYFTRAKGLADYRFANTLSNLSGGLGEVVIGFFLGPLLFALYEFGYDTIALIHWPTVSLFWAIHGVHHQSEESGRHVHSLGPHVWDLCGSGTE